jgi:methionyl-tRNA formyltransferase
VTPPRVAFFGTPAFALSTLQRLHNAGHSLVLVITQPDRPRGRGQALVPGPVKVFATERHLPLAQPERLRDEGFLAALAEARPDLAVVAAYGKILPAAVLNAPRMGTINVHASLLPRWRGAAPVHRAILAGDRETGVTIMRIVPGLDRGPMLARATVAIGPNETSAELEARLATLGADLLVRTVEVLARGPLDEEAQDERLVTYANRLERHESQVDWSRPALVVHNQIRGLQPWPMATVTFRGRRMQLLRSEVADAEVASAAPGAIARVEPDGLIVATSPGAVRLTQVQLEGRSPVSSRELINGYRVVTGDRLDPVSFGP